MADGTKSTDTVPKKRKASKTRKEASKRRTSGPAIKNGKTNQVLKVEKVKGGKTQPLHDQDSGSDGGMEESI